MKPVNPYTKLKRRGYELFANIVFCRRQKMFEFEVGGREGFSLIDIRERVHAAHQLGFEVVVVAEATKLRFEYRPARPTSIPDEFAWR